MRRLSKKQIRYIVITGIIIVIVGIAVGLTLYFTKTSSSPDSPIPVPVPVPVPSGPSGPGTPAVIIIPATHAGIVVPATHAGIVVPATPANINPPQPIKPYVPPTKPSISTTVITKTAVLPFGLDVKQTSPINIVGVLSSLSLTLTTLTTNNGFLSYLAGKPQKSLWIIAVLTTPTSTNMYSIYQSNTYNLTDNLITLDAINPITVANEINNAIITAGGDPYMAATSIAFMVYYFTNPQLTQSVPLPANINCSYSYHPKNLF
jgi:hypothetical protein